ncbi:MAG: DUF2007 domain-containing protein [Chloroflexi bacterium]|nr:DUF2007 domain-containing protein [Chloroflexota bacterium]
MSVDYGIEQVRVAIFENEPLARLWQQRLQGEGIPCVLKSLGAGSGALGGNSYLPNGLYVFARDRQKAIEFIRGTDSPEYLRDSSVTVEDLTEMGTSRSGEPNVAGFLTAAAFTILVIAVLSVIFTTLR